MTTGLLVGRFQIAHLGHLDAGYQIQEKGVEKLLIGIGSAEQKNTAKNPFTYQERKNMVELNLEEKLSIPFEVFPIPDFNNIPLWTNYILQNAPSEFDAVYGGNEYVGKCFEGIKPFEKLDETNLPFSASTIRKKYAYDEDISNEVGENVIQYLDSINARERLKQLMPKPRNPFPCVDGIVEYENGIVLIERKNAPEGWALPGGFLDYGESGREGSIREVKEETGLEFKPIKLLGEYSEPTRDPRQHNLSLVYVGKGQGELGAFDDAKNSKIVTPYKALQMDLAFDHREIIMDYVNDSMIRRLQFQKDKIIDRLRK